MAELVNNPVANFIGSLLLLCGVLYLNGKLAPIKKDNEVMKSRQDIMEKDIKDLKEIAGDFRELKGAHDREMAEGGHHGKRK